MKTIILAGGKGTRLAELTTGSKPIPKPMAQVGNKPLLWHIMSNYSRFEFNDFVVAGGYLQQNIKDYFSALINTNWNVDVIDTGQETMTGGRLLRLKDHVDNTFMFTYGDGIADVNINELLKFHKRHKKICTVTSIPHQSQYGILKKDIDGNVESFIEKPVISGEYINAGFFVCERDVFEYIDDDMSVWEQDPMKRLVTDEQMCTYTHSGFFKSVDSLNDLNKMNEIAKDGNISWCNEPEEITE